MVDAISSALSGLTAQKQKLAASASNIANMTTAGAVPAAGAASTVYRPLQANLVAQAVEGQGAGVRADVTEKANPYSVIYDPSSIYANSAGEVAVPNVDLVEETVNIIETKAAFKANAAVIRTQDEMLDALLDTVV